MDFKLKLPSSWWFKKNESQQTSLTLEFTSQLSTVFSPARGRGYFLTEQSTPGKTVLTVHGAFIELYSLTLNLDGTRSNVRWGPTLHHVREGWLTFQAEEQQTTDALRNMDNKTTELVGLSGNGKAVFWSVDSEDKAKELYAFLSAQIKSNADMSKAPAARSTNLFTAGIRKLVGIAALLFVAVVFVRIVSPAPQPQASVNLPSMPELQSPQPQQMSQLPSDLDIPTESRLTATEFAQVKALMGKFSLRSTGTPFYIFTDPNCPYCKELERNLASLSKDYNPVIIPLGYKPGSRVTSASVLCKQNAQAPTWTQRVLQGELTTPVACEAGLQMVDENQKLFESLRLTATPTMVTPNGMLVAGAADAQQLSVILKR